MKWKQINLCCRIRSFASSNCFSEANNFRTSVIAAKYFKRPVNVVWSHLGSSMFTSDISFDILKSILSLVYKIIN